MNVNERKSLPIGDRFVGKLQELGAAAAHLDGDVAQRGASELESRRLAVIRAADCFQLARGFFLKLLYGHPQSILARKCFFTAWHNLKQPPPQ